MTKSEMIKTHTNLFEQFSAFLVEKFGLYYPEKRWNELERKLQPLVRASGHSDTESFLSVFLEESNQKERLDTLIRHLTIGETYFFRDHHLFSLLEEKILPEIIQRNQKRNKIKIWSAGSSTGEEAYSVAMLLNEKLDLKTWDVSLLATDINLKFLEQAKEALYTKWSFRAIDEERTHKYFTKEKNGKYRLDPKIQKMVKFGYLNLSEDSYPNPDLGIAEIDLILCNNVLIYFSPHTIYNTILKFTSSLAQDGWLAVSPIEAPYIQDKRLVAQKAFGTFVFKRSSHPVTIPPPPPVPLAIKPSNNQVNGKAKAKEHHPHNHQLIEKKKFPSPSISHESIYPKAEKLYKGKRYQEALELLLKLLTTQEESSEALGKYWKELLLTIRLYANMGDFQNALLWVEKGLKVEKLDPHLHYLKGEILTTCNEIASAIQSLKQALFLDPQFLMAYYQLGILELKQNHKKAALKAFVTANKLAANYKDEDYLPATEELTAKNLKEHLQILTQA